MNKNIAISILDSKNKSDFIDVISKVSKKINNIKLSSIDFFDVIIHYDVMDNKFVKNIGVDIEDIKIAKKHNLYADVHLMVKYPLEDKYIKKALDYGANSITIHYEIDNFEETLKYLYDKKQDLKNKDFDLTIGVSIKPNTDVGVLKAYEKYFDKILLMSVEPGLGGQKYIEYTNEKIKFAQKIYKEKIIQVDGGINYKNLEKIYRTKIDSMVIGSDISKISSREDSIFNRLFLYNLIKLNEDLPKDSNVEFDRKLLSLSKSNDVLLGIKVPKTRKLSNKVYKYTNFDILNYFISSSYHEYRRFAIFCISNYCKKYLLSKDINSLEEAVNFINKNIKYIDNWDLTDEVGPNIIGKYYLCLDDEKIKKHVMFYLNSDIVWIKRIGIVSMLPLSRKKREDIVLFVLDKVLYENYHLYQKATGWVLRELYKKDNEVVYNFLLKNNKIKKLPSIMLSYAMEKMTLKQKEEIRKRGK